VSVLRKDDLEARVNAIPKSFLRHEGKQIVHEKIRKPANRVLHEGYDPSGEEAWDAVLWTAKLAEVLANRGAWRGAVTS
jgi:hypothetical protein